MNKKVRFELWWGDSTEEHFFADSLNRCCCRHSHCLRHWYNHRSFCYWQENDQFDSCCRNSESLSSIGSPSQWNHFQDLSRDSSIGKNRRESQVMILWISLYHYTLFWLEIWHPAHTWLVYRKIWKVLKWLKIIGSGMVWLYRRRNTTFFSPIQMTIIPIGQWSWFSLPPSK